MIEIIIYWTGVIALLSVGLLAIFFSWWLILGALLKLIIKELGRNYTHIQLCFFMRELKKKGYAQTVEDIGKDT
jgi:hypothetical protein